MERLLLLAPNPTILSVSLHLCTGKAHVRTFYHNRELNKHLGKADTMPNKQEPNRWSKDLA